jgi:hypothetical protein
MQSEKITISTTPNDEIGEELILNYWEFDGKDFCFSVKSLAEKANLAPHKLPLLISKYSQVTIDKGMCECGKHIVETIENRTEYKEVQKYLKPNIAIDCQECKKRADEERKTKLYELKATQYSEKFFELESALLEKRWTKLTDQEIEALYIIGRSSSKNEIFRSLFPNNTNTAESKQTWRILNKLDRLALIWMERDYPSGPIRKIHTAPGLATEIYNHLNPKTESSHSEGETNHSSEELKMSLKKNPGKTQNRHPEYSGNFTFGRDIVLKKGETYRYGGWLNDDGSIYIRIIRNGDSGIDTIETLPLPIIPKDQSNNFDFNSTNEF